MRKTEMTRLVELGNSFIELGNALQQMEVQPPRQQTDIIQEIYNKVYQQVCRFCPKENWCWQEESSYTLEELSNACNNRSISSTVLVVTAFRTSGTSG